MHYNNIKKHRLKKKITQKELANLLRIRVDYVSMIERGSRTPGFSLAKRFADFFETTIEELFFNIDRTDSSKTGEI